MPTETRYMRSDEQTVNGLSAYKLGTSQTASYVSIGINVYDGNVYVTQYFGIKVWKRDVNGVETLIADIGAIASGDASGLISGTINIPLTSLNPTDAIVVRVYADDFSPPTTLKATFITEQLNAQSLDASTWTVYYYLYRTYATATQQTSYLFRFGISTYNSRIENFTWTPAAVAYVKEVSDSCIAVEVLGKGVLAAKLDSVLGFDFSAKYFLKSLADVGVGVDWFSKDVALCLMDMGVSLDLLQRRVEKSLVDVGLVGDWKSFDLLSCVLDVLKGLDWVPFGVPHVVELRDVFGVYELFNLPPLIVDLNKVWDRIDAYVKVGVQTWLYLWDKVFISDFTIPWDVGKVKELVVAIGWILRDYPLTEWELKRNERIVDYLSEHKMFRLSDFQSCVWREQIHMQEQKAFGGAKQMFYYRSRFIANFCKHLFTVLEEKGYVKKVGLDSFIVLEVPSVEFVNEVARRRIYDIWSFVG